MSTILVLFVFLLSAGLGLVEGLLAYAVAGAAIWIFAKKTFWSRRGDGSKGRG